MKSFTWACWVVIGVIILIVSGLGVKNWRSSQVVMHSQYRFNIAVINPGIGVSFVSVDPTEKTILTIPFPTNLTINSRSKGEYSISSLYKLGSYKGSGGMFARRKIQGFMRVPIPGFIVTSKSLKIGLLGVIFGHTETSLSRFDAMLLLYRVTRYRRREISGNELVRAGVIEGNSYHSERLQEYVGTRLFDWEIGATGLTVAIINASGENGLGSDLADFLSNLGLDVVMVRSINVDESLNKSSWQVSDDKSAKELSYIFQNLFGFDQPKVENIPVEYRASVLIKVGKDVKDLF